MSDDLPFGQWLKRRRQGLGFTQRALGKRVGYSYESIRKVETGDARPSRQMAERLADALELPPAEWPRFVAFARAELDDAYPQQTHTVEFASPAGASAGDQPPAAPRHNLPMALTRFFGRESESAQIKELLAEYRLVTITGPGGVGKTRLAQAVAESAVAEAAPAGWADGVWLVDLAPLADPALVGQAVAQVLGAPDSPSRGIQETLIHFLRQRHLLLLLDNCEHLLDACAQLADSLLRACPRLTLLATSREPLGVSGEAIYPTPALPFPVTGESLPAEGVSAFPAVRLFVDRARLVHPDYQITSDNAEWLARVCQRLDGIPLAIEMAAARMNMLTAEQLAGRLDNAFSTLARGRRTALPRQQTMRAALDWSWALLAEPERLLLARLSVFAGGCTLAAAEAVCAGEGLAASQVLETLAALAAKSMVVADRRQGQATRYRLLEIVRQYGAEKLAAADDGPRRRRRHRDYFAALAEQSAQAPFGSETWFIWVQRREAERENFREALVQSFRDDIDPNAGPELVMALPWFWSAPETVYWLQKIIAWCPNHAEISSVSYANFLSDASAQLGLIDPQTSFAWLQQAIEIERHSGPDSRMSLMWNLVKLASHCAQERDDLAAALAAWDEAMTLFQEIRPDSFSPARTLGIKGHWAVTGATLANCQGQYLRAKQLAAESIGHYAPLGYPEGAIDSQLQLGIACWHLDEPAAARQHFLIALRLSAALTGYLKELRETLINCWLGLVDLQQGQLERASETCRAALRVGQEIPDDNVVARCLALAAGLAAAHGRPQHAATLSGASQALFARQRRQPWEDAALDRLFPGWYDGLAPAALTQAFAAGRALSVEEAVAFALGSDVSSLPPNAAFS